GVALGVGVALLVGVALGVVPPARCGTTLPWADDDALVDGFELVDGVADPDDEVDPDGVVEPDVLPDGVGVVWIGIGWVIAGRKFNCAARATLARSSTPLPGIDTMIRSPPWITTSAEETPRPFTRLVMMSR